MGYKCDHVLYFIKEQYEELPPIEDDLTERQMFFDIIGHMSNKIATSDIHVTYFVKECLRCTRNPTSPILNINEL